MFNAAPRVIVSKSSDPLFLIIPDLTCRDPGQPDNSIKSGTNYSINSNVTYSCETGYELTSGDELRTCGPTGFWSGSAPDCDSEKTTDTVEFFTYLLNCSCSTTA